MSILDTWWTGQVTRKHTMRNLRAENVAEHTWGVMHVLLHIWPDCPKETIVYCEYHDSGEEAVGDIPATTKWENPGLGQVLEGLETGSLKKLLPPELFDLFATASYLDKLVVEFCDRVEFCFSMIREFNMGNTYARTPFLRSFNKAMLSYEELCGRVDTLGKPALARAEAILNTLTKEYIYADGK